MPANYITNPLANLVRGLATPIIALPVDTDPQAAASYVQPMKADGDTAAYSISAVPTWWRESLSFFTSSSTFTSSQAPFPNYGALSLLVSGTGPTVTFQDPSTVGSPIYSGRTCAMTVGTAASAYAYFTSPQRIAGFVSAANLYIAIECDVMFAVPAGTNGQFFIGFGDNQAIHLATNFVAVQRTSGAWQLTSQGTSTPTGVIPSASVFQRMKLVCFGASTPEGIANGGAGCQVFVNGSTVASASITVPPATNCFFSVGGTASGASAPVFTVGNWTACWSRY